MNKDAILASIIGFGIGLMITGAVLVGPTLLPMLKKMNSRIGKGSVQSASTQISPTIIPSGMPANTLLLTVDSPTDESIADSDTLKISGKATKGSIIVVDGDLDEAVTTVTDANTFQAQISLKEGVNDISVTNVTDQTPSNKHITVYYTPKS